MFRKFLKKGPSTQLGMVLPIVLILLCVVSFIIIPGLQTATGALAVNSMVQQRTMAYYAADAGIADATWRFKHELDDPVTEADFPYNLPGEVNGMTVTVSLVGPVTGSTTKSWIIQSTAKLNGIPKGDIFASIAVTRKSGYPFKYAIGSTDGNIIIDPNCEVHFTPNPNPEGIMADLWANGSIQVSGTPTNTVVDGTAYYTDVPAPDCTLFTTKPSCSSQSTVDYPFQPLDLPWYWDKDHARQGSAWPSNPGDWNNTAQPTAPYIGTTYKLTSNTSLGGPSHISYIKGNLDINGQTVTLYGTVWVDGYIYCQGGTINTNPDPEKQLDQYYLFARGTKPDNPQSGTAIFIKGATVNANGNLNLVTDSTGKVHVEGIGTASLGVVFAPNSEVYLKGNQSGDATKVGAIIGKSVQLNSNVDISYNTALKNNPIGGAELNVVNVTMGQYSSQ